MNVTNVTMEGIRFWRLPANGMGDSMFWTDIGNDSDAVNVKTYDIG
jgi:hypothetical protein